jgi:transglutaminase-like putative cysteine protease
MKTFHIDCELDYDVARQTLFVFNLGVASTQTQRIIAETISTSFDATIDEFSDEAGRNRFFRLDVAPRQFTIRYLATVEVQTTEVNCSAPAVPLARLPGALLSYVQTSRYCEVEAIFSFACRKFANLPNGYQRVLAICQWVRENIDYQEGSSTLTSGAHEILANRAGVCRDFAHVSIAFCRALNIPARFVTAYTKYRDPPQDFHAVMEAFLGDRWYLFDPTGLAAVSDLVRIGTGRDASDVPFATFFGSARLRRLSPLVEPAIGPETLVSLQSPGAGILLAPDTARSGRESYLDLPRTL